MADVNEKTTPTPNYLRTALVDAIWNRVPAAAPESSLPFWTPASLRVILDDVGVDELKRADRQFVLDELDRLLGEGAREGWWDDPRSLLTATHGRHASRLDARDGPLMELADSRRRQLATEIGTLAASNDALVVAGALLMAAAYVGGIVQWDLLKQLLSIPVNRHRIHRVGDVVWVELLLKSQSEADRDSGIRNSRLWTPDALSALLLGRLITLSPKAGTLTPENSLAALRTFMQWPKESMQALVGSARAWWAAHLPSCIYEYAVNAALSPSLPPTTWMRLLSGGPLAVAASPPPSRKKTTSLLIAPADRRAPSTCADQLRAIKALTRLLYVASDQPLPTARKLKEGLEIWRDDHAEIGGWAALLGAWARHVIVTTPVTQLNRPGLLRYLRGLGKRWILLFHDIDPWTIAAEPARYGNEIADRMEALREDLAQHTSAGVVRSALTQFLQFVGAAGGPVIELCSEWRTVVSAGHVDANLLTPAEYVQLLAWLGKQGAPNSYAVLRNQVLTILAFRLGPRWEELKTRERRDLVVTEAPGGFICGCLDIRPNGWFKGKSLSSARRLPLEKFLTTDEIKTVQAYISQLDSLGRTHPTDLIFADLEAPDSPPRLTSTHDIIQSGMRWLSGDTSLVFHHLRHSAACFIFLRLFLNEADRPAVLSWIAEYERISARSLGAITRSYATLVIGRGEGDGSRLQLLSRILGHIDPATAMHSYVHFSEVVLADYASRLMPTVPIAVQARLDGIKTKSVRRRRIRQRHAHKRSNSPRA